jgi:hypothetical protein
MNDLDWKMPALIGGLITGVLSVVPVVQWLNCCFCGWALVGGAVAAKMLIGRSPRPLRNADGAKIGLLAGAIAAGVYLLLALPLSLSGFLENLQTELLNRMIEATNDPSIQEMLRRMIEESANRSLAEKFISSLILLIPLSVILGGFSVLGGLLGVALFEKRQSLPPAPPYPPQYPNYPPQYPPQSGGE